MQHLKNPIAIRNGEVITINDLSKGCDEVQAYLTGLYKLLKEIIDKGSAIYLPPLNIEYQRDYFHPIVYKDRCDPVYPFFFHTILRTY